jgi:hypothetical protein
LEKVIMKTITGIYHKGKLKLKKPLNTKKPIKVTMIFDEEPKARLALSDFSFLESQELLKDYKGSFSDEVVEERRRAL